MTIDHHYTDEPVCPQCGHTVGDAWEWCTDETRGSEVACECGATFRAFPNYDVSYSTELISGPTESPTED